jgi:hypothetical protein
VEIFQNAVDAIIEKIDKENKVCYIMGDFNIDLLKSESSFIPLTTKPTRITSHSATLIDNIFTNNIDKIDQSFNVHICNMDNNKECEKQTTNEPDYTRFFNKKNINSFTDEIKNVSWSNVLTNANPEIAFNEFSDSFRKIYETNFPLTKK